MPDYPGYYWRHNWFLSAFGGDVLLSAGIVALRLNLVEGNTIGRPLLGGPLLGGPSTVLLTDPPR
jgi:hypothetical protein